MQEIVIVILPLKFVFGVVVCGNEFLSEDDEIEWDVEFEAGFFEDANIWDDCLDEVDTFLLDNDNNEGVLIREMCLKDGLNCLVRVEIREGLLGLRHLTLDLRHGFWLFATLEIVVCGVSFFLIWLVTKIT